MKHKKTIIEGCSKRLSMILGLLAMAFALNAQITETPDAGTNNPFGGDDGGTETPDIPGGTESVCPNILVCSEELIINGNFENGYVGFTSSYSRLGDRPNRRNLGKCGTYRVDGSARAYHGPHWQQEFDHTYGNDLNPTRGLYLYGDAHCSVSFRPVWQQEIDLVSGVTYRFGAWICNLNGSEYTYNEAIFRFTDANGQSVAATFRVEAQDDKDDRWLELCGTYTPLASGKVTMEIQIMPSAADPNFLGADFGLDDITLRAVSSVDPRFQISENKPCAGEEVTLTSLAQLGNHEWVFSPNTVTILQDLNGVQRVVFNQPNTTYTITHRMEDASSDCDAEETREITTNDNNECATCTYVNDLCGFNAFPEGDMEDPSIIQNGLYVRSLGGAQGGNGGYHAFVNDSRPLSGTDQNRSIYKTKTDVSGTGNFLYVDPPANLSSDIEIYKRTITLELGAEYKLSAWFSNLSNTRQSSIGGEVTNISANPNLPRVQFLLDNNLPLTPFVPITYQEEDFNKWIEVCATVIGTGAPQSISIILGASSDEGVPADVGIDNIFLEKAGTTIPDFTVTGENCAGTEQVFTSAEQTPVTHSWQFGDGGVSSDANPTYTYAVPGTYTITHTVTYENGCTGSATLEMIIENCCAVDADFTYTQSVDINDCSLNFENLSTANGNTQTIDSHNWTFYDLNGTILGQSADINPNFNFDAPGTYRVCLEVKGSIDDLECESTLCQEVEVVCEPIEPQCGVDADFTWEFDQYSPNGSMEFDFNDNSTYQGSTQATNFTWDLNGLVKSEPFGTLANEPFRLHLVPNSNPANYTPDSLRIVLRVDAELDGETCVDYRCYTLDVTQVQTNGVSGTVVPHSPCMVTRED